MRMRASYVRKDDDMSIGASVTEGNMTARAVDRRTVGGTRSRGKRRLGHLRDCGGFTIIEALVAAFLFTVGLVATAQLEVMASGQVSSSRQQSDAAALAAQTIEQYRDINFYTLVAGTYNATPKVGSTTYTVQTVVTQNDPQTGVDRVAVTVTWKGKSYATSTLVSPLQ